MHVTPRIPLSLLSIALALVPTIAVGQVRTLPDAGQILQEPRAPQPIPSTELRP